MKEWTAKVLAGDLIYYLQMFCPHVCDDTLPQQLIDEVEGVSSRDNGLVLVRYLNEIVFSEYRVLCSTGVREYFFLTSQQRENSYSAVRRSSIKRQSDGGRYSSLGGYSQLAASPPTANFGDLMVEF